MFRTETRPRLNGDVHVAQNVVCRAVVSMQGHTKRVRDKEEADDLLSELYDSDAGEDEDEQDGFVIFIDEVGLFHFLNRLEELIYTDANTITTYAQHTAESLHTTTARRGYQMFCRK